METELGNRETAGRVVVEKEVVKEVLAELLNEIPAFKALMSGEGVLPTRQSGEGPTSADEGTSREADGRGEASKGKHSQTGSGASYQTIRCLVSTVAFRTSGQDPLEGPVKNSNW